LIYILGAEVGRLTDGPGMFRITHTVFIAVLCFTITKCSTDESSRNEYDPFDEALLENPQLVDSEEPPLVYSSRIDSTGYVYLHLEIDSTGNITETGVLRGIDPYHDSLALEAIKRYTYLPARQYPGGYAVKSSYTQPMRIERRR
jgi:hypothetical protein